MLSKDMEGAAYTSESEYCTSLLFTLDSQFNVQYCIILYIVYVSHAHKKLNVTSSRQH